MLCFDSDFAYLKSKVREREGGRERGKERRKRRKGEEREEGGRDGRRETALLINGSLSKWLHKLGNPGASSGSGSWVQGPKQLDCPQLLCQTD